MKAAAVTVVLAGLAAAGGAPAQVPPAAREAFARVVAEIGARLRAGPEDAPFLRIDALRGQERDRERARALRGEVSIRGLPSGAEAGERLEDGALHHWVGTAFAPGGRLEDALRLSRDYPRYGRVFAPDIVSARLLAAPAADVDRIVMRLRKRKIVTLVYDVVETVRYGRPAVDRAWSEAVSVEIHEVKNAGNPDERAEPTGEGRLWGLCTWWRYRQVSGGLWIENESLVLTDDVGFPASLVVGPLLRAGPREGVENAVRALRSELRR